MTKERKTSILALIIICIACLLAGCATKKKAMTDTATEQETTKVEQVKDTAITETHDTTRITQKLVPVEIAVQKPSWSEPPKTPRRCWRQTCTDPPQPGQTEC